MTASSSQDNAKPQPLAEINDIRAPLSVANTAQQYAYWGGAGGPSGAVASKVDRIDFANDTNHSSNRGPLTASEYYRYATASQTHGYWAGGSTPGGGLGSYVDRVSFANDTVTAAPVGALTGTTDQTQPVANVTYGYITGGRTPSVSSKVDRIDFANDTGHSLTKRTIVHCKS